MRRPLVFALAGGFAVAASLVGAAVAKGRYLPAGSLPGLKLEGQALAAHLEGPALEAAVHQHVQALLGRKVQVASAAEPKKVLAELTFAELGLVVDESRLAARIERLGHEGDLLARSELARKAREGALDVPLSTSVDLAALGARLRPLKEKEDRSPASARLDLERRSVVPEHEGVELDPLGASASLLAAARDASTTTVLVPVFTRAPRTTAKELANLDVKTILGTYETFFSRRGDQENRSRNIEMAASRLDGRVLSPGEVFSFNATVGDRSAESGFETSWEILKGEMTEGVGGGTCQVASTFHAAAFFGGLEVLNRLPHSRPSAYIPMGLDATVVYPTVDLKVRNPFAFPVVVHMSVVGNRIKAELLGAQKPVRIRYGREVLETLAYRRKVVESRELRGNEVVLKQHGIRGYRILRKRIFTYRTGRQREEQSTNLYPPTTEIYEVPPGFDPSLLPPLPGQAPSEDESGETTPVAAADPMAAVAAPSAVPAVPFLAGGFGVPAPTTTAVAGSPTAAPDCVGADCRPNGPTFNDVKRELSNRGFKLTEAKGAHAPTEAQANPTKDLEIRR